MTEAPVQPAITLPRGCSESCGVKSAILAALSTNPELAAEVGARPIRVQKGNHDMLFPQSCEITAKAGRTVIVENMEVACHTRAPRT